MPEKRIGTVEHYYPKAHAAAVKLTGNVEVGDRIHIVGHGDDVEEEVTSIQIDHRPINKAKRGQSVGIEVPERVHAGDEVYRID